MKKSTVLLVDDDIDFVNANRAVLEAAGYEVIVAHNGGEGLKLARENRVDVAVLDVHIRNELSFNKLRFD